MRKLTEERKQFLIRYARRKHLHEIKRRLVRKRKRLSKIPIKKIENRNKKFLDDPKKVEHFVSKAPNILSLTSDPDSVISYFRQAKKSLSKKVPVFFDLKDVTLMGPETFTYFIALITENDYVNTTPIQGNIPDDLKIREMFKRAGFYKYVIPDKRFRDVDVDPLGTLIHIKTRNVVEPELAGNICSSAMKHTFNTDNFLDQNFYTILIECMANTRNHSNYGELGEVYDWWLLAYKETDTKITKFCFLDLGVGIFQSLLTKYAEDSLVERLKQAVVPSNNRKTLEKIFQGKRETSTTLPGRGYGLNFIYKLVKEDQTIKKFTILSNNIIANIGYNMVDSIKTNKHNFRGTMFYWELTPKL
ncbi:MAG: hypothetical protein WC686_02075 [Candidatus Shapirobacteria bacterium]|jgi:hypothetical protein